MKNILLFRSAKHPIVNACIKEIKKCNKDCVIWLCVQEQCKNMYKEYKGVKFIAFPNGMYNYEKTMQSQEICDQLKNVKFDDIYIPCNISTSNYDEVEKIILQIVHQKRVIFYDINGEMHKKKIGMKKKLILKFYKDLCETFNYVILKIIYFYVTRRRNDRRRVN